MQPRQVYFQERHSIEEERPSLIDHHHILHGLRNGQRLYPTLTIPQETAVYALANEVKNGKNIHKVMDELLMIGFKADDPVNESSVSVRLVRYAILYDCFAHHLHDWYHENTLRHANICKAFYPALAKLASDRQLIWLARSYDHPRTEAVTKLSVDEHYAKVLWRLEAKRFVYPTPPWNIESTTPFRDLLPITGKTMARMHAELTNIILQARQFNIFSQLSEVQAAMFEQGVGFMFHKCKTKTMKSIRARVMRVEEMFTEICQENHLGWLADEGFKAFLNRFIISLNAYGRYDAVFDLKCIYLDTIEIHQEMYQRYLIRWLMGDIFSQFESMVEVQKSDAETALLSTVESKNDLLRDLLCTQARNFMFQLMQGCRPKPAIKLIVDMKKSLDWHAKKLGCQQAAAVEFNAFIQVLFDAFNRSGQGEFATAMQEQYHVDSVQETNDSQDFFVGVESKSEEVQEEPVDDTRQFQGLKTELVGMLPDVPAYRRLKHNIRESNNADVLKSYVQHMDAPTLLGCNIPVSQLFKRHEGASLTREMMRLVVDYIARNNKQHCIKDYVSYARYVSAALAEPEVGSDDSFDC